MDFKKSWIISVFFFSWPQQNTHICNMWKKAWDQGWTKWGNFCKAAWSSLEDQRWEDFLSINFRGEIADLQDAEQIHQKLQGLQTLSRHRESLRPFFWETWWKDYCTLQHVFDWVELNQSMSLEGRCSLSGEVQTFAQFPRYLVESQVFTLYMFPLKSCKKSQGTPDFPQQKAICHIGRWFGQWILPGRVWRIFTQRRRRASSWGAKPRWGEPTRIPSVGEHPDDAVRRWRLTGDFFVHILYIYACRYVVAFVVSFVFCFRIALRFKAWEVRASNEARRWLHHVSVSWIRIGVAICSTG